jgi:muramoyltetrapeptide carboxypeptidase
MAQFSDPAVHAIVCARGGYGSQRILELLDYELIARRPKILIGYSDITALLLAIHARSGLVVFHGPMVACELAGDWLSRERAHSWRLLVDPDARTVYRARAPWILGPRGGVRRGRLLGGCLSLLTTLSGTPFQPDTRGALLFFEEVGEDPYRVDRALQHLRHAGWFDGVAAVLVGRMADCVPRDQEPSLSLEEVFAGVFGPLGVPVIAGYGFGHQGENPIIPIGCQAEVDLASGLLRICEAAVRAPGAGRGPASRSVRD